MYHPRNVMRGLDTLTGSLLLAPPQISAEEAGGLRRPFHCKEGDCMEEKHKSLEVLRG